jgi:hypothetical protein
VSDEERIRELQDLVDRRWSTFSGDAMQFVLSRLAASEAELKRLRDEIRAARDRIDLATASLHILAAPAGEVRP